MFEFYWVVGFWDVGVGDCVGFFCDVVVDFDFDGVGIGDYGFVWCGL